MKNTLILLLLIAISGSIYSQDLIVTNDGDSINCKITNVKHDNIYFTFKHKDEIRSTLLPVSGVKEHKTGFYQTSEVPEGKIAGYKSYPHFRVALSGGYSYMTAKVSDKVPSDFKQYIKELKSGYHFDGDITYYFTEILGAGVKYSMFGSSNRIDDIWVKDIYGNTKYGHMSDDLKISFIAPMFSSRFLSRDKKNAFVMSAALGYMGYSNNGVAIDEYKMTGSTLGMALDFGYDIGLSDNLSLGFKLSLISGTLFEYDISNGKTTERVILEAGEYEGLNRIDLSIGLRFNK